MVYDYAIDTYHIQGQELRFRSCQLMEIYQKNYVRIIIDYLLPNRNDFSKRNRKFVNKIRVYNGYFVAQVNYTYHPCS